MRGAHAGHSGRDVHILRTGAGAAPTGQAHASKAGGVLFREGFRGLGKAVQQEHFAPWAKLFPARRRHKGADLKAAPALDALRLTCAGGG
jgi:hypothetical protein